MSAEINTPSYYAVLTADVRYDERLKPNEKLLFAEITALANFHGYCSASNSYFSKLYKVHKNTVGNWVNKLVELGYIRSELIFNDKKQIVARHLYISENSFNKKEGIPPINKKIDTPKKVDTPINKKIDTYQQNDGEGINEMIEGNTTRKNITSKNTNTTPLNAPQGGVCDQTPEQIKNQKITKREVEEYSPLFEEWWSIYPRKIGKRKAYSLWRKEKLDERADQLIEKLKAQVKWQYAYVELNYIPHPSTYLNQARYEDEIEMRGESHEQHATHSNAYQPRNKHEALQQYYQQQAESALREGALDDFDGVF